MVGINILTRRELIVLSSLTGAGTVFPDSAIAYLNQTTPSISFVSALRNTRNSRGIRQKYLEQLLSESEYGNCANIIYDHDGSITKRALLEGVAKIMDSPKLREYYASDYVRTDPSSFRLSDEELRQKARYLSSDEGKKELHKSLTASSSKTIYSLAWCDLDLDNFGKNLKAKVYISKGVYLPVDVGFRQVMDTFKPSSDTLKAIVEHELAHAFSFFHGFDFGNNIKIDSSNILEINSELLTFVSETNSGLHAYSYAQRNLGPEGRRFTLFSLFSLTYYSGPHIVDEASLTPFERKVYDVQVERIKKVEPDIEALVKKYVKHVQI